MACLAHGLAQRRAACLRAALITCLVRETLCFLGLFMLRMRARSHAHSTHAHAVRRHAHARTRTLTHTCTRRSAHASIVLTWGPSIVNTMPHGLFRISGKVTNSELSKMQVGTPCAPQPCLLDARALFGLRYGGNIVRGRLSPHAASYSGRLLQMDC